MKYFIFILLVLASCAPMQFENAGSQNTLKQDQYDCRVELGIIGAASTATASSQASSLPFVRGEMTECMERKGWRRTS